MPKKIIKQLIENHRNQLYILTCQRGLNFNHPEVIKKSVELDQLIHIHNALTLNREVDVKSVLNRIYNEENYNDLRS